MYETEEECNIWTRKNFTVKTYLCHTMNKEKKKEQMSAAISIKDKQKKKRINLQKANQQISKARKHVNARFGNFLFRPEDIQVLCGIIKRNGRGRGGWRKGDVFKEVVRIFWCGGNNRGFWGAHYCGLGENSKCIQGSRGDSLARNLCFSWGLEGV